MITSRKNRYSLLAGAVLLSLSAVTFASDEMSPISIPMVEDAQVFADFTADTPAVLNYFTSATQEQIIDFYRQNFGDSTSQETKRGRLTLTYTKDNQAIRVVISQQNNKRQVDVIVKEYEQ